MEACAAESMSSGFNVWCEWVSERCYREEVKSYWALTKFVILDNVAMYSSCFCLITICKLGEIWSVISMEKERFLKYPPAAVMFM